MSTSVHRAAARSRSQHRADADVLSLVEFYQPRHPTVTTVPIELLMLFAVSHRQFSDSSLTIVPITVPERKTNMKRW
jgi:hypothetical protein